MGVDICGVGGGLPQWVVLGDIRGGGDAGRGRKARHRADGILAAMPDDQQRADAVRVCWKAGKEKVLGRGRGRERGLGESGGRERTFGALSLRCCPGPEVFVVVRSNCGRQRFRRVAGLQLPECCCTMQLLQGQGSFWRITRGGAPKLPPKRGPPLQTRRGWGSAWAVQPCSIPSTNPFLHQHGTGLLTTGAADFK